MKTFYVFWTYVASYGGPWERQARSAEEAALSVVSGFSPDFAVKGTVYVFESLPAFVYKGSKAA